MSDELITDLLDSEIIEILYGDLRPIFEAIKQKKFKFDPSSHSHEVVKRDLMNIKSIRKFTAMPSERLCIFETELQNGRLVEVSCEISVKGVAVVKVKPL